MIQLMRPYRVQVTVHCGNNDAASPVMFTFWHVYDAVPFVDLLTQLALYCLEKQNMISRKANVLEDNVGATPIRRARQRRDDSFTSGTGNATGKTVRIVHDLL